MSEWAHKTLATWIAVGGFVALLIRHLVGWTRNSGADAQRLNQIEGKVAENAKKIDETEKTVAGMAKDIEWLVRQGGGTPTPKTARQK